MIIFFATKTLKEIQKLLDQCSIIISTYIIMNIMFN